MVVSRDRLTNDKSDSSGMSGEARFIGLLYARDLGHLGRNFAERITTYDRPLTSGEL